MPEEGWNTPKYCSMTCLRLEEEVLISFLTSVWYQLIQSDFNLISGLESDFTEGEIEITLQYDFTEGKTEVTLQFDFTEWENWN